MSIETARAVAERLMGWANRDGWWYRYDSATGYKVATQPGDKASQGFFRPDRSYFQMGLIEFRLWQICGATMQFSCGAQEVSCTFNDGKLDAEAADDRESLKEHQFEDRAVCIAAALSFYDAWKAEHGQA